MGTAANKSWQALERNRNQDCCLVSCSCKFQSGIVLSSDLCSGLTHLSLIFQPIFRNLPGTLQSSGAVVYTRAHHHQYG